MPLKKLNRLLKQFQVNKLELDGRGFVEIVDKISSHDKINKIILKIDFNLQYSNNQITGQMQEVLSLLESVKNDIPHAFSASINLNGNPRQSLNISVSFSQKLVTFNMSNADEKYNDILECFLEFFPGSKEESNEIDSPDKEPSDEDPGSDTPEEVFLPDAFKSVPNGKKSDRDVFVIMSFGKEHRDIYFKGIKPTLEKMGLKPVRVDEIQHNATVTPEIMRRIEMAPFVIADLTGERPNVYYEVGYAHRANKEVILTARRTDTKVHFDVASINRIEYDDLTELAEALEKRVKVIIERLGLEQS